MTISKIYLIADTHFNHTKIIKYCDRPFNDVKEMNETIINNWNKVIGKDDIVYHLGDLGLGSFDELKEIFDILNGKKYLVMRNHDLNRSKNFYLKLGFIDVYKKQCQIGNLLLTHWPTEVEDDTFNYYGHIHNKEENEHFLDGKHKCISLEKTNYMPIEISL